MAKTTLYISIPVEYINKTLTIKALGFKSKGDSPDQALLECIKSTPLYIHLMLAKFVSFTDHRGRKFSHMEVPFSTELLTKINETEPYPKDKKKEIAAKSHLAEITPEDVLKWGY